MNRRKHGARKGAWFMAARVAALALVLLSGRDANAQASSDSMALPSVGLTRPDAVHSPAIPPEREEPLDWAGLKI